MAKRLTQDEFVKKAQEKHQNKYDYSKAVYINGTTKVIIICSEHGEFLQKPYMHLQGQGCPVCAHAQRAKTCLERYSIERPVLSEESRKKSKQTFHDKYNVSSPSQIPSVREKIKQTNMERYGVSNPMQNADIRNKAKQTNTERYGVSCSMQNEDVKARHRESVKAHYGVENPMQSAEVQEKAKQTYINRYGVENPRQCPEINAKIKNTCFEKYGVPYAVMNDDVREKIIKSFTEKYGVKNPMQNPDVVRKGQQTNLERYGVGNPMQSEAVQQKYHETMMNRYGVSYPLQSESIRLNAVHTVTDRYGVENVMKLPEIQERAKRTCMDRYGVENPMLNPDIRQKVCQTTMQRYGVSYAMQNPELADKCLQTKREHGTFSISNAEETLYLLLCSAFGEADILRQYSSDVYPYLCDFYVKSRNLYIEFNGSWTHGSHWYDDEKDTEVLNDWICKSSNSEYYKNAVTTWTYRDVIKRDTAKDNNLNYVTFWDSQLWDALLWLAMNCPDGQDWKKEYSWVSERTVTGLSKPDKLTGTYSNLSAMVKYYQSDVFYEHEMQLWDDNPDYKNMPLQVWLYCNRLKYTGKSPQQLSDLEILRGFTISGIHKGYTVFDTSLMNEVIKKYNIKSVYDPCAGWGERMLYCYCNDIDYFGVDINEKLQNGYERMMKDFSIRNQNIVFADSSVYQVSGNFDAVITCPPYGSTEKYSNKGAENLSKADFLNWWEQVVQNSAATGLKYFCFQINRKWRDSMLQIVQNCGYELIDELYFSNNKSSHFTRKSGTDIKKEYESMIVLERKNQ